MVVLQCLGTTNHSMGRYLNRSKNDIDTYRTLALRPILKRKKFSVYRGVTKGSANFPYKAMVSFAGVRYYCGCYKTEIEAARAYNEKALEIIGPEAIFNVIPNE